MKRAFYAFVLLLIVFSFVSFGTFSCRKKCESLSEKTASLILKSDLRKEDAAFIEESFLEDGFIFSIFADADEREAIERNFKTIKRLPEYRIYELRSLLSELELNFESIGERQKISLFDVL